MRPHITCYFTPFLTFSPLMPFIASPRTLRIASQKAQPTTMINPLYNVQTKATGPVGSIPITEDMLLNSPSGDLFGMSQNAVGVAAEGNLIRFEQLQLQCDLQMK